MATLSCIMVLVLGNMLGAIVRGITGFGSAILNLCVWVVFTCLGFDAGTLQQAVVAECVCSEFCALPLLRLTKAASTCDWRLTSSLFIFGSLGAPVGAALLTALPVRSVEFVMACVLVLVIGAHCHVLQHIQRWLRSRRQPTEHNKQCSYAGVSCQAASSDSNNTTEQQVAFSHVHHRQHQPATCAAATAASTAVGGAPDGQELQPLTHEPSLGAPAAATAAAAAAAPAAQAADAHSADAQLHTCHPQSAGLMDSSSSTLEGSTAASTGPTHQRSERNSTCSDSSDEETALLLTACQEGSTGNNCVSGSSSRATKPSARAVAACSSWQGFWQAVEQRWAHANEPEQRRATLRVLLYGSLAGSVSGAMAGMTGMGGPPLMMLYEKLHVKKDTVRGCNAVLSVLQFRVIAYALTGTFTRQDLGLYVAVSVAGLAGLCLGSHLAVHMDQATFSRVMVALMLLCCGLLFASSAGLTGS